MILNELFLIIMKMKKTTEETSLYNDLDKMDVNEILTGINNEDKKVANAVENAIPQIEKLITALVPKMKNGGRLFYIGAGTSGRLGIVDASECPPTYGIEHGIVVGIIAGGDAAIRKAVEFAEDDTAQAWKDLMAYNITSNDVVVGIAASGSTPYVVGGLEKCKENQIVTGAITCNENTAIAAIADFPIEVIVGPEFVTGSTRMKAGSAQKLVLNMITTATMILLGKVEGNKMVNMQISNNKLIERGIAMIISETNTTKETAKETLLKTGSVKKSIAILLGK